MWASDCTSLSPVPVVQPQAVYNRTDPLCHRTIFLLVFHKVNHLQPFLLLSITVFASCLSFILQNVCPNSFSFLCFIKSTIVKCISTFSPTISLLFPTVSTQRTFNNLRQHLHLISSLKVFWSQVLSYLCFSSIELTDETLPHQFWDWPSYCYLTMSFNVLWFTRLSLLFVSALQSLIRLPRWTVN